jgi:hypothetical protein
MNLEEALVVEFGSIPEIIGKVFPLYTGEGVEPPFLVYVSSEGKYDSSLNEFYTTREISVEIHIVGQDYSELKSVERQVIDKIVSFRGRAIGGSGPFVYTLQYDQPTEMFEGETHIYRASFDMRVRI